MAYGLKGAATLLLRSFDAPGGKDEPRAAQAFERPRLSHPHHVLTLRSALVDRAAQNGICGPIFHDASGCRGVARCLHMAWVWPARGNGRGRSEDAAEASNDRALSELLAAHALHVLRGARF